MKKLFPFLLGFITFLLMSHFFTSAYEAKNQSLQKDMKLVSPVLNTAVKTQSEEATASASSSIQNEPEMAATPVVEISAHDAIETAANRFFNEIPKRSSLHHLTSNETHDTPTVVLQAGQYLAQMHGFFASHSHEPKVELDFYLKCSQRQDLFDSIRAVCAARADKVFNEMTGQDLATDIFESKIAYLKDQIVLD